MLHRAGLSIVLVLTHAVAVASCVSYTSEDELASIHKEIADTNARERQAAVRQSISGHSAVPLEAPEEEVAIPPELARCRAAATPSADPITLQGHADSFVADCAGFTNLVWGRTPLEAHTTGGKEVLLVPSRTSDDEPCTMGSREGRRIIVIEPHLDPVEKREVRKQGAFAPERHTPKEPTSAHFFVVEGHHSSDLQKISAAYRGATTETVCDSYTQ